ncbi:uncharacterized protein LOC127790412 isoform X2 [Diospyros lotus]|uniref:uncharacterized protein LOC127790412 isoform X2 n=1 Tax=Diospyros lotus TaxID=55363 RepID=UPI00224F7C3A|nr:uncharacterized protein LOC127790412 isoform X2 [Diospyros lotus]
MAIARGFGFSFRPHFPRRTSLLHRVRNLNVRLNHVAAVEPVDEPESFVKDNNDQNSVNSSRRGGSKSVEWKKLSSKDLGISNSMITKPTRVVLNGLKRKGFDVYLVGGCVRDLILKRTPKDFDIITSAELKEVVRTFSRCEIVGRRFPICHVHIKNMIVEVSSFSTRASSSFSFESPMDCDDKDYIRWRNCLQRDFTINGLMFDPYANLVYDYMGGVEDIRKAKVRTIIRASLSFLEDCARILRAMRIAARLGFRFTRETAQSIKSLSCSVLKLDKGRILMEMNYLLAYGSAEASLRLLWKYGLLEILLPIQSLLSNMDKLLAPDTPCHSSLWVVILAFHKALSDHPRDPLVVAAFSLAVYNGGDVSEAINIARKISIPCEMSFYELLQPQKMGFKVLKDEVMDLASSVKCFLTNMTDEYFVSQAMSMYDKAPFSNLVFIPLGLYSRACRIFECAMEGGKEKGFVPKQGREIDYELLAEGNLKEVRHVFARVVFDTVFPINSGRDDS